jgi:RNA polymerase sigma-70 factor (ECF subfamily)
MSLLRRARAGDREAVDAVFRRYLPRLRRWAAGRLPRGVRDIADTQDLVQDTLLQTFRQIGRFEPRNELAFQVYVRRALINRIRGELRGFRRRPGRETIDECPPDLGPSPFEAAVGREAAQRYELALERLKMDDRELIVARVELGSSYEENAAASGRPTAEAARKACERALLRLSDEMGRARE